MFGPVPAVIFQLLFSTLLGLFVGLEREWSEKPAGIRTFALLGLLGTVFTVVSASSLLLVTGGAFIVVLSFLLGLRGFVSEHDGLSLTTSVSMFVAYSVGILSGSGLYLAAVTVAVLSALLLVLKRELHAFAGTLSRQEMRSATEFAILAFVVYPLLPSEPIGPLASIDLRLAWLLVVAVSAIGFFNYIVVQKYDAKGFVVTGFVGGLVSSTSVVGSMVDRAEGELDNYSLAVSAVLLANAAMSIRNAAIVIAFVPTLAPLLSVPLLCIAIVGIAISYATSDWDSKVESELQTPFSTTRAIGFGGFFIVILFVSAAAEQFAGSAGFILTSFLAGLVSSGSAATTAVTLFSTGSISAFTATLGVLAGTVASIFTKLLLAYPISAHFTKRVLLWSVVLTLAGGIGLAVTYILI